MTKSRRAKGSLSWVLRRWIGSVDEVLKGLTGEMGEQKKFVPLGIAEAVELK